MKKGDLAIRMDLMRHADISDPSRILAAACHIILDFLEVFNIKGAESSGEDAVGMDDIRDFVADILGSNPKLIYHVESLRKGKRQ